MVRVKSKGENTFTVPVKTRYFKSLFSGILSPSIDIVNKIFISSKKNLQLLDFNSIDNIYFEGYKDLRILDAIYLAAREGKAVPHL